MKPQDPLDLVDNNAQKIKRFGVYSLLNIEILPRDTKESNLGSLETSGTPEENEDEIKLPKATKERTVVDSPSKEDL